jgi:predicted GTPase
MGYGEEQLAELQATIEASGCDVVVNGSPFRLARLLDLDIEIRDAVYRYADAGSPTLADAITPWIEGWGGRSGRA